MTFVLALASALAYGIGDFSGGLATRSHPAPAVLFTSQLFGLGTILILAPIAFTGVPGVADLIWGAASGLGGAAGIMILYQGFARTSVSIVSPVAALTGAVLPLLVGLVTGDSVSSLGWLGVALILPATVLLGYEHNNARQTRSQRSLAFGYGLAAGLGFGLFFVLIAQTGEDAGLWPLLGARVLSVSLVGIWGLAARRRTLVRRSALVPTIGAGVLDMVANVAFMLAVRGGSLILATIVTSAYPAPSVVLARLVHHEKIHPLRWVGLGAAAIGVALMGIS
jgi:drug/metabolite transporter (DMT)-like permease